MGLRVARVCIFGSLLFAAGCSASTPEPGAPQPRSGVEKPAPSSLIARPQRGPQPNGELRLGDVAVPLRYELDFEIDPAAPVFAGHTNIELQLNQPTRRIDLHASKMEILEVGFQRAGTSEVVPGQVEWGVATGIAVHLAEEVSGHGTLRFSYRAGLEEVPDSIYRVKAGDDWYAFSQLESQMAREAFPCFDEPRFKTPFAVTVTAPAGLTVVGNAPAKGSPEPVPGTNQHKVGFEVTKPMPTYLVALAVGPFERTSADLPGLGPAGQPLPHDIYTVRGKRTLTDYAAQITAPILDSLQRYLGSPYPYQKLDQVAVPNFHAGAMENVGLVTYRESILLLDAELASARDKITARSIVAHELAHMWFGNLVTAHWWDDIWLNEAFATWMSAKVLTEIAPELETPVWSVTNMLYVMQQDALSSARPIRKEVIGSKDVENAFDGITYEKGFAVLRMLENWLGPERFQSAIRAYLEEHAWGTATMADFLRALDDVTDSPITNVAGTFIGQAGIPLVEVERKCLTDSAQRRVSVRLRQSRYAPLGAGELGPTARAQTWAVPVCLSWVNDASPGPGQRTCTLLERAEQDVELPLETCPDAVYPNAGELGYYHFSMSGPELLELTGRYWSKLNLEERVGLPWHALALLESGRLDVQTYVGVLRNVAKDPHRLVVDGVIAGLERLTRIADRKADRETISQLASTLLTPHARRLGRTPKLNEPASHGLMRSAVWRALGRWAPDVQLQRQAANIAARFARGAKGIDLEQLELLLPVAARRGTAALHAGLVRRLDSATPGERVAIIVALGYFEDPTLLRASYDLWLLGKVLPTERHFLLQGASESEPLYREFWSWYRPNEAELMRRSGERTVQELPALAAFACTTEEREQVMQHFGDRTRYGAASETIWREALETVDRCVALRRRYSSTLADAVRRRGPRLP